MNLKKAGVGFALAGLLAGGSAVVTSATPAEAASFSSSTCKSSSKLANYMYSKVRKVGKKYTMSNTYVAYVDKKCKNSNIKSAAKYAHSKSKKAKSYAAKNKWAVAFTKLKKAL